MAEWTEENLTGDIPSRSFPRPKFLDAYPSLPYIEMGAMFVYRGRVLKIENILPHSDGCDVTLKVAE